jgi:RND superfamily putative drug exporter
MDYQVFLVSRMSEEHTKGANARNAIVNGFSHSSRVVTAAALIMISVFAGFILPDDAIIKSIGFALAFGVLIDAFIIRMTLIPALMAILGTHAWAMPAWLSRVIPHVDIDCTRLDHQPTPARA